MSKKCKAEDCGKWCVPGTKYCRDHADNAPAVAQSSGGEANQLSLDTDSALPVATSTDGETSKFSSCERDESPRCEAKERTLATNPFHCAESSRGGGKVVWLIRHGEGEHNRARQRSPNLDDWKKIVDPSLTDVGMQQARAVLSKNPALVSDISSSCPPQIVFVSPLLRTMQTALLALPSLRDAGIPFVAIADLQEVDDMPSDTGRPVVQLDDLSPPGACVEELQLHKIDLSGLSQCWFEKAGPNASTDEVLEARMARISAWLEACDADHLVIVGHSGVFKRLTGASFSTCEARCFEFRRNEETQALQWIEKPLGA